MENETVRYGTIFILPVEKLRRVVKGRIPDAEIEAFFKECAEQGVVEVDCTEMVNDPQFIEGVILGYENRKELQKKIDAVKPPVINSPEPNQQ